MFLVPSSGPKRFAMVAWSRRWRGARALLLSGLVALLSSAWHPAFAADPYASNNGLYPVDPQHPGKPSWSGPYRTLNFDYPDSAPPSAWLAQAPRVRLTVDTAPAYVAALKKFVEPSMRDMIEKPNQWNQKKYGWYDMPWQAEGGATGGREAILAAFSGQVLPKGAFKGLDIALQNHTVVYYDAISATMLKKLWANPFNPNRGAAIFPEGAMVIKAGAVTATPKEWAVVDGSTVWNVWRPTVADLSNKKITDPAPSLVPLRVMQFDIIVKDSVASPDTGWVFTTFVYNKDAPGQGTWDKLVPLGAMWGNDPDIAGDPARQGLGNAPHPAHPLKETWINYSGSAPYALEQLGWGGRLSGPIDVSKRHQVIYTDGVPRPSNQRASSCLSCHGTAQYPFVANLYPSPNRIFPRDGSTFLLYPPGSPDWNRWFQNRPGTEPQNRSAGAVALDYDMLVMFALGAFDAAAGTDRYIQKGRTPAH